MRVYHFNIIQSYFFKEGFSYSMKIEIKTHHLLIILEKRFSYDYVIYCFNFKYAPLVASANWTIWCVYICRALPNDFY